MWFSRRRDPRIADEIRFHRDRLVEDHMAAGMSRAEAERRAFLEFGGVAQIEEACRDVRGRWLDDLVNDLRYAWRTLSRSPAFFAVAVLSLALGLGANTAIFSLVDAVLLRSLPVDRPEELLFVTAAGTEGRSGAPPYPCFERFRAETSAFSGMAAFATDHLGVRVDGAVEQVFGQAASGNYFELLGLRPALGRLMTAADEKLDPPVAVIGYGYWQRRFGGSPDALGRTVSFRDRTHTIVGVTPPEFWGLDPGREVDITLPITIDADLLRDKGAWWFEVVGRLRPAVSAPQAAAQVDTVFQSFMRDSRSSSELLRKHFDHIEVARAARGLDSLRSRFSKPLYVLTLVAAMVLLIACANLASLLLVRDASRARELAIRVATGAGRGRLLRQLLAETLLLFLLGATAGLAVAYVAVQELTGFWAVGRNPVRLDVHYDWWLVAFAVAVALVAALTTGLWPGVRASRTDPQSALKGHDTRLSGSGRLTAAWRVLLTAQMAVSLVLLLSSVVFVKTMVNLRAVDLGFSGTHVLTMSIDPRFGGDNASEARERFWVHVLDRVRALPGVGAASLSVLTPLSGRDTGRMVTVPGFESREETDRFVHVNHVSEEYFRTFGIQVLAGRALTSDDATHAVKVAVVNEATARAYFTGRDPIGAMLEFGPSNAYRVVGVVRDHKHMSIREPAPRFAYVPIRQRLDPIGRVTLGVASAQPHSTLARTVAGQVRAIHPDTLVSDVIGVDEQIDATLVSERLLSILATLFAAVALGLAAIGLVGVVSYSVARRRTEFGIRLALGAAPARVAWAVVREVLVPVALGVAIGLPVALSVARLASGLLFGVTPAAPGNYLLGAAVLAFVACLAAWLPARRASRVDPMVALRHE